MKTFCEARITDIAVLFEKYSPLSILALAIRRDTRKFLSPLPFPSWPSPPCLV